MEEFAKRFPESLNGGKLSLNILSDASNRLDAEDLQDALIIGHVFGFPSESEEILCGLVSQLWHHSHEDLVSSITRSGFSDERTCSALYDATQITPLYLEYDESRALAVKAIWALGEIPGRCSEERLETLTRSPAAILREAAKDQLGRRRGAD